MWRTQIESLLGVPAIAPVSKPPLPNVQASVCKLAKKAKVVKKRGQYKYSPEREAAALAAANKRIGNILKKAGEAQPSLDAQVNPKLLQEPAEQALHARMTTVLPQADARFEQGDYTASLQALSVLRAEVDAFFDGVMVNAEQMDLRLNRQGLLKQLHQAMNRVADLSQLAAG